MRLETRPATEADAALVHAIYAATPEYFDVISIPMPTEAEVATELAAAAHDSRRRVELVLDASDDAHERATAAPVDAPTGRPVVGYVDFTLNYPDSGDATVNLLLIHGALQNRGYGRHAVRALEARLRGRVRRLLAAIYGRNPRAEGFWTSLGYRFAIDARPVLEWYAKILGEGDEADDRNGGNDRRDQFEGGTLEGTGGREEDSGERESDSVPVAAADGGGGASGG